VPTYQHAWILATEHGATAPSSTAKTGTRAWQAFLPTRPGLVNTACFALALVAYSKRGFKLDSLRHTYTCAYPRPPAAEVRASRSEAACGIDGQELAAHADRLLASLAVLCGVDYDGVAGSCG
jgi:hypothetical protein